MRILYITTISVAMGFFENRILRLLEEGHQVEIACNEADSPALTVYRERGCKIYPLSCTRSVTSRGNLKAIGQIRRIAEKNQYDIVHCHTPIAAACTRLACRSVRRTGTKVMYTAHGFHFFKGAPLSNWLLFYPVEWLCSFWTDVLITINREDFTAAKSLHAKKVEFVPGVGIDLERFRPRVRNKAEIRKELGIPEDAFVLMSAGELNENKNHQVIIQAVAACKQQKLHYLIAGKGEKAPKLKRLAQERKVAERVHLLGYRTDIHELLCSADVYVHPSFREGLPVAVMEAMASGLPCVASDIRGNRDLLGADGEGGYLCKPSDVQGFTAAIDSILRSDATRRKMGERNARISENFANEKIFERIREIYGRYSQKR